MIFSVLQNCPLFTNINETDLPALLNCLSAEQKPFRKGAFVFTEEDSPNRVGIVLSGAVHIQREDYYGNRTILSHIGAGGLFGESFSCAKVARLPISVMATESSEILFLDCNRILSTCSSACLFHSGLIKNLTRILADKNVSLTQKLEHITRRTTREKVLSYLSEQAHLANNNIFDIPFNRQEMADYLSVERSGLSIELSKMQAENLLRYRRNHFELLRPGLSSSPYRSKK
jgi:CRP-like cAMP-binding protein